MTHPSHDEVPPNWLKAKMSDWFWSLTPTCKEVARLTSEERDGPLPLGLRLRLGLHRALCRWCARYAKQLDLMHKGSRLFAQHIDQIDGPSLDGDVKARMKRAIRRSIDR